MISVCLWIVLLAYEAMKAASNYTGFGIPEFNRKGYLQVDDEPFLKLVRERLDHFRKLSPELPSQEPTPKSSKRTV